MDEIDLAKVESKATYAEIGEYVLEHNGLKVIIFHKNIRRLNA